MVIIELDNNQIVAQICKILDKEHPKQDGSSYQNQITYVTDRKGMIEDMQLMITKLRQN